MTNLTQYEKGYSPSAIQRKYSLTYEQGYELAERLKKTQELKRRKHQAQKTFEREQIIARQNTIRKYVAVSYL